MTKEERYGLYADQKKLLDTFLEHHTISKEQYKKSFGDLTLKMGMNTPEDVFIQKTEDISACLSIRYKVFVEEQKVPIELEKDELDSEGSGCDHFLILKYDIPVGTFRCYPESPERIHFQRFCILEEFRGLGLGRLALEFAERFYKKSGYKTITLNAQCSAIGFYEKCGFKVTSGIFDDAGIPHRAMIKTIEE